MSISFLNLFDSDPRAGVNRPGPVGWRAGMPVSRADFVARVCSWQTLLAARPGTQYALYLDDSIEFAAALFGLWRAGKTVRLCADIRPASIAALREQVDGFVGLFPPDCAAHQLPDHVVTDPSSLTNLLSLNGAQLALVVHTSGSTGVAQAIPKKLSQLDSEVAVLEQLFGKTLSDAAILSTVSHHHIYGLLFKVLWPLAAGRALHAETIHYPEQLTQFRSPAVLIASPAHLKRLPEQISWQNGVAIFCSGGVLTADAALHCQQVLGQTPIEVYGSSESGGIAWRQQRSDGDPGDDGDAWQAMPNLEWKSVDGQIAVRSPHCFDSTWLQMADRIELLEHGRFRLVGRADRIVKIEEKRVSLDALEQCLAGSDLIDDARVLLIERGETAHEQLVAVVVLSASGNEFLREQGKLALNRQLRVVLQHIAVAVALPRRWRYVQQLPIDAQGKTTQILLKALFERPVDAAMTALTAPDYRYEQQWTDQTGRHAELTVSWPAALIYFEGHFPIAAVLPGVVQVDWAIRIARQAFGLTGAFGGIRVLKFQHVLRPNDVTRLVLRFDPDKNVLNFSFDGLGKQYSSGRVVLVGGSSHE